MIKLGSKVKDKVTGYTGIATAATEYLQGCRRIAVQTKGLHEGKTVEADWFDEPQLLLIKENVIEEVEDKENGGPAYLVPPKNRV